MLPYPDIGPNLIEIGPLQIRWYGFMYILGFLASFFLVKGQKKARRIGLTGQTLQNLILYPAMGLVIGARLGYVLFYQFGNIGFYLQHPLEIIAVWHGGMSFHGGLIGALTAGILFCWKNKLPFLDVADVLIVTAPIGLGLGRIGNFINGELFGRPSSVPWAMIFPSGGTVPRHPSQLYEAALEGVLLFFILWLAKDRPARPGAMVCLFLAGYGVFRYIAEFFRQPDPQLGLLWEFFTMGQVLCLGMVIAAAALWFLLPKVQREKGQ